jgi:hypothetical protein
MKARSKTHLGGDIDAAKGWTVTGWVGTVDAQKSIDAETNVIPVLAWGCFPIQLSDPKSQQSSASRPCSSDCPSSLAWRSSYRSGSRTRL